MARVITYCLRYGHNLTIDLCERHGSARDMLGPVQRGLHRGGCADCRAENLCSQVTHLIGHKRVPGGDLRTIVDQAIADGVTDAEDVVAIIQDAEEEARARGAIR